MVAVALVGAGCGTTRTVTVTAPSHGRTRVAPYSLSKVFDNPAQPADPATTTPCSATTRGQACVAVGGAEVPSNPNEFPQRNCKASLVANSATSCSFAENAFYEYYGSGAHAVMVHDPTSGHDYEVSCADVGSLVGCTGPRLYVSFPEASIILLC